MYANITHRFFVDLVSEPSSQVAPTGELRRSASDPDGRPVIRDLNVPRRSRGQVRHCRLVPQRSRHSVARTAQPMGRLDGQPEYTVPQQSSLADLTVLCPSAVSLALPGLPVKGHSASL